MLVSRMASTLFLSVNRNEIRCVILPMKLPERTAHERPFHSRTSPSPYAVTPRSLSAPSYRHCPPRGPRQGKFFKAAVNISLVATLRCKAKHLATKRLAMWRTACNSRCAYLKATRVPANLA